MISKKLHVDWQNDQVKNLYLKSGELSGNRNTLFHYLYPFIENYYGRHNPLFWYVADSWSLIKSFDSFQLRDGFIPLSLFFENVEPETIKGKIYIHSDFLFLVTNKWKDKVRFYNYQAKKTYRKNDSPEGIFITGFLNETMVSSDELVCMLDDLINLAGENDLRKKNVWLYLPFRQNDLWGGWKIENTLNIANKIYSKLKCMPYIPSWEEIQNKGDFRGFSYFELNKGHLIKDSYLYHLILSKGAGEFIQTNNHNSHLLLEEEHDVSFYHRMKTYRLNSDIDLNQPDYIYSQEKNFFEKFGMSKTNENDFNPYWKQSLFDYLELNFRQKNNF